MEIRMTRKALGTQLREHFTENGISYDTTTRNGALAYVVNGETLTPGEASDKYLSPSAENAPPKTAKETAALFRAWLREKGIGARCRIAPGRRGDNIQVYTAGPDVRFTEDEQRAIRTHAVSMKLTWVRGLPIDPERMTDPYDMSFYLPGH